MPRASSLHQLPDDLLNRFHECIRDPSITQLKTVEAINAELRARGIELRITKSAANRYAQHYEKAGERMREAREVAKVWIGEMGTLPEGEVGRYTNEMVRTLSFDITHIVQKMMDGDLDDEQVPEVVKMIKDMAITQHRLEMAQIQNVKREQEIRKKEREKAADLVAQEGKRQGASATTIDSLRKAIMQELAA